MCVGDLSDKGRGTEFEIGDERQAQNISDGRDKLAANQRCLRESKGNFAFGTR